MDGLSLLDVPRPADTAERPALVLGDGGAVLRHADLAAHVAAFADHLARAGVGPGARVAVTAPNAPGALVAIHALLALGAVLVPVHPRLTPPEAQVLLDDARPALVLREADLPDIRRARAPGGIGAAAPPPRVDPAGDLAIVYTSGTTGRPKGAVLPRRAFVAAAAASAWNLGFRDDDRWLLCLPLCHVGGLSIVTRCLLARRAVILAPRFDPDAILASIVRDRATLLSVVPTMLLALLEADRKGALAGLRVLLVGGAAAPERLLEVCAERRIPALATYGLTEACSQVTAQRPRDPRTREPGAGLPLPGVELRVAGAGEGGAGSIRIRGPALFRGYFRGPDAPVERAVDAEGWFDTGDVGALDAAGRLHVLARRTDLVVTGGENVYPAEVEAVIEACDGVTGALVFGVPDARWGHVVAAAVTLGPAAPPGFEARLAAALAARLAPHKRPRRLCVVPELPRTASGKLRRAGAPERFAPALRPFPP